MLGVTPLRNGQSHGLLGNMHLLGEARLQTMFNDGGKGGPARPEDLAIEGGGGGAHAHRRRGYRRRRPGGFRRWRRDPETASDDSDSEPSRSTRGGFVKKRSAGSQPRVVSGFMTARARVTSRSMWTDEGRLLANLRDAAERSVEDLEGGARLSAVDARRPPPCVTPATTTATSGRTSSSSRTAASRTTPTSAAAFRFLDVLKPRLAPVPGPSPPARPRARARAHGRHRPPASRPHLLVDGPRDRGATGHAVGLRRRDDGRAHLLRPARPKPRGAARTALRDHLGLSFSKPAPAKKSSLVFVRRRTD